MAAKRHQDDGPVVDSPPKCAKQVFDTVESSAEFAKPVYLVAALLAEQPAASVFMVDAAAVAGGDKPPRSRTLARLPGAGHAMSFVAAHSKHGSWIVGVGGLPGPGTIIYDPSTLDTFQGPELSYPMQEPVLISHLGKVYAISRRPRVHYKSKFDFMPWFESLSFNEGVPCIYRKGCSYWEALLPPPFFPLSLNPFEFRNPPDVSVSSYAALGSHILLSGSRILLPLQQQETGTYAFHVVKKTWDKVCGKNLPFVGQAVPLGGSLFAACRVISNNAAAFASVFHMSMEVSSTPVVPGAKLTASLIREFPVASEGEVPRPLFCPLGKGSFCSIICRPRRRRQSHKCNYSKGLHITLTTFKMDNIEAIWTACQTENAHAKDFHDPVQVNQTYKLKAGSPFLASPMPVVTALSMDRAYTI